MPKRNAALDAPFPGTCPTPTKPNPRPSLARLITSHGKSVCKYFVAQKYFYCTRKKSLDRLNCTV
jgi:hypothetical protein